MTTNIFFLGSHTLTLRQHLGGKRTDGDLGFCMEATHNFELIKIQNPEIHKNVSKSKID